MKNKQLYDAPDLIRIGAFMEQGFASSESSSSLEDPQQPGSQTDW